MNKKTLSVILFVIGFIVTYAILCLVIPNGIKWALEATPIQMLIGHICYMATLKTIISVVVGLIVGALPMIKGRKK